MKNYKPNPIDTSDVDLVKNTIKANTKLIKEDINGKRVFTNVISLLQ